MLLRAGALSLLLLIASRLLGLARESAQAAALGITGVADVVVLMLSLPDWVTGVLASGALAYVLLPHWAQASAAGRAQTQRRVARYLLGLGLALAVVQIVWAGELAALLVAGLADSLNAQAALGMRYSALALPAALLAALWATRLQHERDFVGMVAANLVFNAALVLALLVLAWQMAGHVAIAAIAAQQTWAVQIMGFALLAGAALRLLWLYARLRRKSMTMTQTEVVVAQSEPALPALPLWFWAVLSAGLPLALPFVARSLASPAGEGALAAFNYAYKLIELPLVLLIQLVATLAFPLIAQAFAQGRDVVPAVRRAMALSWALACACTAGLLVGAPALAKLLFGWGRMQAQGLADIAQWAALGSWSLLPQALTAVALTVLASRQRLRPVALVYALALGTLLACRSWAGADGARLMGVLVVVQALVAVVLLALLGRAMLRALPWAAMAAPALALAFTAALAWTLEPILPGMLTSVWAGLFWAVLAGLAVLGVALWAAPELRSGLSNALGERLPWVRRR